MLVSVGASARISVVLCLCEYVYVNLFCTFRFRMHVCVHVCMFRHVLNCEKRKKRLSLAEVMHPVAEE